MARAGQMIFFILTLTAQAREKPETSSQAGDSLTLLQAKIKVSESEPDLKAHDQENSVGIDAQNVSPPSGMSTAIRLGSAGTNLTAGWLVK
mmetsp:Transcript_111218/g.202241  ORF Transcript_111218/g.202241 Transcript_111218/m.202241 type:complete len:91 (+) Transcript_111218:52-324(+)